MIANPKNAFAAHEKHVAQNTKQVFHNIQPAAPSTFAICREHDSNKIYFERIMFWEITIVCGDYCLLPIGINGSIAEWRGIEGGLYYLQADGAVESSNEAFATLELFLVTKMLAHEVVKGAKALLGASK